MSSLIECNRRFLKKKLKQTNLERIENEPLNILVFLDRDLQIPELKLVHYNFAFDCICKTKKTAII